MEKLKLPVSAFVPVERKSFNGKITAKIDFILPLLMLITNFMLPLLNIFGKKWFTFFEKVLTPF